MIPKSIEEVTPQWLTEAFAANYPGAVIHNSTIDRVIHGTSSKWFLKLERNDAAIAAGIPEKICLKVNWENHADETLSFAIWCLEGRFYKYLRPHLPAPAPEGFYGDYDDETGQGICIMEDLATKGARFGDNIRPLSVDQAAAVLDDLAALHAAWWGSQKLKEFSWLRGSFLTNTYEDRTKLDAMVAPPERGALLPAYQHDTALWVKAVDRIVEDETGSSQPFCLIHGDTHLGNSYYLPESDKLLWLDWQLVSRGRPPREVNYFLNCALDTPTRRANETALIKHYLAELKARGVEDAPDFDRFWKSYILWPIWGLVAWGVTQDGWQPRASIHETMRRFSTAIDDYDTFRVR